MAANWFEADYGCLPAAFFSLERLTNPVELLRGEELYRTLRLCGIADEENGERASDWELFRSVCRAIPMLVGHPMRENILQLLRARLSIEEIPDASNCERLWRDAVAFLAEHVCDISDVLPHKEVAWLSDSVDLPQKLPASVKPVLLANLFLDDTDCDLSDWRQRIKAAVDQYAKAGGELVVLRLARDFSYVSPDPYHVGLALRSRRPSLEEARMLTVQLLRELCVICRDAEMRLLLEADCDASLLSALDYTVRTVGLPMLFVAASDATVRDLLVAKIGASRELAEVRLAIRLSALPCSAEREIEWKKLLARYPAGRLCVITAADLRVIEDVQSGISNELARMF